MPQLQRQLRKVRDRVRELEAAFESVNSGDRGFYDVYVELFGEGEPW